MIQPAFDPSGLSVPTNTADDHRLRSLLRRAVAALALATLLAAPAAAQDVPPAGSVARPRASVTPQQLDELRGRLSDADGSLVIARGVVRRVHDVRGNVEVTLQTRSGTITVIQPAGARPESTPVDAVITVRGVLSQLLRDDRSLERMEILAGLDGVHIESQPAADPFSAPTIQYESLRTERPADGLRRRVKMTGVVTRQRPGRSLYIRTATKPLYVETDSTLSAMPGDFVEVVGFPDVDEYAPFLADAVFRRSRVGVKPQPVAATVSQLLDGRYDAELVQVDAIYSSSEPGQLEFTLVLQQDSVIFNAHVLTTRAGSLPQRLKAGQRVQLTGICSVIVDSDRTPRSFRLLLRDADDVSILAAGPTRTVGSLTPWWAWLSLALAVAGRRRRRLRLPQRACQGGDHSPPAGARVGAQGALRRHVRAVERDHDRPRSPRPGLDAQPRRRAGDRVFARRAADARSELDLRLRLPRCHHPHARGGRRQHAARVSVRAGAAQGRAHSHRRACAGAGRRWPGDRRHRHRARPERARSAGARTAPGAEDGGGRPPRHRHRPRLQQPDHGPAGLQRRVDRTGAGRL